MKITKAIVARFLFNFSSILPVQAPQQPRSSHINKYISRNKKHKCEAEMSPNAFTFFKNKKYQCNCFHCSESVSLWARSSARQSGGLVHWDQAETLNPQVRGSIPLGPATLVYHRLFRMFCCEPLIIVCSSFLRQHTQ